jgi:hypothetical protein
MKQYTAEQLKILSLASAFRSLGEYWSGTPEHATYQMCAGFLLATFGLTDKDRVAYDDKHGGRSDLVDYAEAMAPLQVEDRSPERALYTLNQILEVTRLIEERDMYQGAIHKALRFLQQGYSVKAVMTLLERAEKKILPHDDHAFVPAWLVYKSRNYWRRFWMWVAHWGSDEQYR